MRKEGHSPDVLTSSSHPGHHRSLRSCVSKATKSCLCWRCQGFSQGTHSRPSPVVTPGSGGPCTGTDRTVCLLDRGLSWSLTPCLWSGCRNHHRKPSTSVILLKRGREHCPFVARSLERQCGARQTGSDPQLCTYSVCDPRKPLLLHTLLSRPVHGG